MKRLPLKASALFYLHFLLNMAFCQFILSQSSAELLSRAGLFNFGEIPFSLLVPIIMVTFWPLYFHFAYINKKYQPITPLWWFIIAILISLPTIPHIYWFTKDFIPFPFLQSYLAVQRLLIFFHVLYISFWQLFIMFLMRTFNKLEHSRGYWMLLTLTIAFFTIIVEIIHVLLVREFYIPPTEYASVGIRFFTLLCKFYTILTFIVILRNIFAGKKKILPDYSLFLSFNIIIIWFFDSVKQGIREDFLTYLPALHIYSIIWCIILYTLIKTLIDDKSRIIAWIEKSHITKC
jgi:hypothetical protein